MFFSLAYVYRICAVILLANQEIDAHSFDIIPGAGCNFRPGNLDGFAVPVGKLCSDKTICGSVYKE